MNQVDIVCLQHEFGIFGGKYGSHILELLRNLRMPVVTTMHTVVASPAPEQKTIVKELGELSDRLVVMSYKAKETLKEVYGMAEERIVLIHHGIPDVPFVDPNYYKDQFGVAGRKVILTFGLISSGKGIEHMIDALPAIVNRHSEVAYIVLGATHPNVKREEGEAYRLSLQLQARERGVDSHVIFHNRFVDLKELCEFLGAADIYVTPYVNREQIVSGTLAYALGAGKATVSTPYWYAEEMLDDGRGRIVPFQDADALSAQVVDLLDNEVECHAMRKRAYSFCRNMIWKEVARRYIEVFIEAENDRQKRPRVGFHTKALDAIPIDLPQVKLDHLKLLTDDVGILQHAKFMVPDRFHGYCTDDNARALIVAMMARDLLPNESELTDIACRYLGFLYHAFNEANGRFRNFMGYDRRWLEEQGTEDCHGRAIWGLGMAVALSNSQSFKGAAMNLFERALSAMAHFRSPRAWAFGLVGIHAYLRRFGGDSEVRRERETLAEKLFELFQANATEDWPWIEGALNYANGKIPQAMLLSGRWLHRSDMIEAGLGSLNWLIQIQTDSRGHFAPIGNHGWFVRNGQQARFDQQPIEAQNMIEACIEAYKITKDAKWIEEARCCFDWFLGRNDLNAPLYDYRSAGCCDGLTADGANLNQGAESTLAWLLSLLHLHSLSEATVVNKVLEDE
jgi:glycosyltransferase involved in cell wall biosynthesis